MRIAFGCLGCASAPVLHRDSRFRATVLHCHCRLVFNPMMPRDNGSDLVEVARPRTLEEGREAMLVAVAMGCPCWLLREGGAFHLCVESEHVETVSYHLRRYEEEQREPDREEETRPGRRKTHLSLWIYAWSLALLYLWQWNGPGWVSEAGSADAEAIIHRLEWWRTITALCLHGNLSHLAVNIAAGAFLVRYLLPLLGTGLAWLSVLAAGGLGNWINAWFYGNTGHDAIGASTAVFAALAILVTANLRDLRREPLLSITRRLAVPLGAGVALLAWFGTGGERTDVLAHLWGFVAGLGAGVLAMLAVPTLGLKTWKQNLLAATVPAIVAIAWILACRHGAMLNPEF